MKEKPEKKIKVSASRQGGDYVISVEDNGDGIPAEIQGKVFDPFFTTKDPGKGTGVGLALSAAIAKDLGGYLDFKSGKNGTTFCLRIPVVKGPGKVSEVVPIATPAQPSRKIKQRVIVVEDEDDLREILVEMLQLQGCEVLHASNGRQALEILAHQSVDAVLTDLNMPIMGGWQLLKELDRQGIRNGAKVAIVTGRVNLDDLGMSSADAPVIDAIFYKPCDFQELINFLNSSPLQKVS